MKVVKRILIKTVILLLVIAAAGAGAASYRAYRQSTPEYAVRHYLSLLIDNNAEKAFTYLDQSEAQEMSLEEYKGALEAKRYSLYASYTVSETGKRRDSSGNEYTDYKAEFLNAADEVQAEETFTVKKQSNPVFGIFDYWKTQSAHCLIRDFEITVPRGAEVYLGANRADSSWIVRDDVAASYDRYRIPTLIPGTTSLVVRHPAFESVNTTLDVLAGNVDYTKQMPMKKSAQNACLEQGVKVLKTVYTAAAKQKTEDSEGLLKDCQKDADKLIKEQDKRFHTEEAEFRNIAVSSFAPQFGELVYTEEKNGAITTKLSLGYHYVVREDVLTDTEEMLEDGTYAQQRDTVEHSGDAKAELTMAFYDGAWHVTELNIPVVPKEN